MDRDIRALLEAASQTPGIRVEDHGDRALVYGVPHPQIPNGIVTVHYTPSDRRGVENAKSRLRKIGVDVATLGKKKKKGKK